MLENIFLSNIICLSHIYLLSYMYVFLYVCTYVDLNFMYLFMYVCMQQVVGNTSLLRPPAPAPTGTYTHPESSANRFSVALLEEEIADLKKSLRRAESRLVRIHTYIYTYIHTYIHYIELFDRYIRRV
jgi:hypothetical protein